MRIDPSHALGAKSLQITLHNQSSAQMIEVQHRLEPGSQDKHSIQLHHFDTLIRLGNLAITLECDRLDFLNCL